MIKITDVVEEEYINPGTRMCAGCSMALLYRFALKGLGPKTILTVPASCLTVLHGMQGFCTTNVSVLHTPFATTGASASGIVASLEEKGLINEICVVAFAGDGGTADIGIQALSGAAERGTNFIYACYDNEAYMNTGVQRSGSTPLGAFTATTPGGKMKVKKNMQKSWKLMEYHMLRLPMPLIPLTSTKSSKKREKLKELNIFTSLHHALQAGDMILKIQ